MRAGEGTTVSGAISANLLDRVRGHRLAEIYTITFQHPAAHRRPRIRAGWWSPLWSFRGGCAPGRPPNRWNRAPALCSLPGDVPPLYQGIGRPAQAVLAVNHPERFAW